MSGKQMWLLLSLLSPIVFWANLKVSAALPISNDESDNKSKAAMGTHEPFSGSRTLLVPSSALKSAEAVAIDGATLDGTVSNKKMPHSKYGIKMSADFPASPADLLMPDKFQFYTYNDQGDMITRQMTLKEIQTLIASGGGGQTFMEMHEPQKPDDVFAGGKNVMEVVEKVQNVLKSAMNKPPSGNLMVSAPSIPEQANAEWSSILPSILSGDAETVPVINDSSKTEKDSAEKGELYSYSDSTSVVNEGTTSSQMSNNVTTITADTKQQQQQQNTDVLAGLKIKVSYPSSHVSTARPDYPANPMIPVPVITAEQKLSTELPPAFNHSTIFQIVNVITTDDMSSYKNGSVDDSDPMGNSSSTMMKTTSVESEVTTTTATVLATADYVRIPNNGTDAYVKIAPVDVPLAQLKSTISDTTTERTRVSSNSTLVLSTIDSNVTSVSVMQPIMLKEPPHSAIDAEASYDKNRSSTKADIVSSTILPANVVSSFPPIVDYGKIHGQNPTNRPTESSGSDGTSAEPNVDSVPLQIDVTTKEQGLNNIAWTNQEALTGFSEIKNGTELLHELSDSLSSVMNQVSEAVPTVWYVSYTSEMSAESGLTVTRINGNTNGNSIGGHQNVNQLSDADDGGDNIGKTKLTAFERIGITESDQEARIEESTKENELTTILNTHILNNIPTTSDIANTTRSPLKPIEATDKGDVINDDQIEQFSTVLFTAATVKPVTSTASSTIAGVITEERTLVDTLHSSSTAATPLFANLEESHFTEKNGIVREDLLVTGMTRNATVIGQNVDESNETDAYLATGSRPESVAIINHMLETVSVPPIPENIPSVLPVTLPTNDGPILLLNANTVASSLIAGVVPTAATASTFDTGNSVSLDVLSTDRNVEGMMTMSIESTTNEEATTTDSVVKAMTTSTDDLEETPTIFDTSGTLIKGQHVSEEDSTITSTTNSSGQQTILQTISLENDATEVELVAGTEKVTTKVELLSEDAIDNYYDKDPLSELPIESVQMKSNNSLPSVSSSLLPLPPVKVTTMSYPLEIDTVHVMPLPQSIAAETLSLKEESNPSIRQAAGTTTERAVFKTTTLHTSPLLNQGNSATVGPGMTVITSTTYSNGDDVLAQSTTGGNESNDFSWLQGHKPNLTSTVEGAHHLPIAERNDLTEKLAMDSPTMKLSETTDSSSTLANTVVAKGESKVTDIRQEQLPTPLPTVANSRKPPVQGTVNSEETENTRDPEWTLISQHLSTTTTATRTTEAPTIEEMKLPLGISHSLSGLDTSIRSTSSDVIAFSRLCNELAFSFWTATNKGLSTARSLALSPFGMTSLLAMIFLGARGPTSEQMNELLRLDDVATFNPHLIFQNVTDAVGLARGQGIANAAFVRELFADKSKVRKLMPFYKEQAHQFYEGLVAEVNFATINDLARRRTNLLIRKQTGGRVKDFVRSNAVPLRPPLAALSANVFETDCNSSRASSIGRDGELYFAVSPHIRQRRLVPVPATVWRLGVLAGYEPSLDATAVALGGADRLVSTVFVLPGQQGHAAPGDTLDRLEERLLAGAFRDSAWDKLLKVLVPRTGLELQIPKFSHRSVVNATAALKRMGLDQLFSTHADLKGINGVGNQLHLADVLQINLFSTCGDESMSNGRHHVEVYPASPLRNSRRRKFLPQDDNDRTYEGDDAARFLDRKKRHQRVPATTPTATTRTTSMKRPMPAERPRLKLDRPFLYFVRHNPTGIILHMGRFNPRLLP